MRAKEAAGCCDLQEAREIALEAIQHVTMESARLHLLLGKIAISLNEKDLLRDARMFLEFLRAKASSSGATGSGAIWKFRLGLANCQLLTTKGWGFLVPLTVSNWNQILVTTRNRRFAVPRAFYAASGMHPLYD